MRNNDGGIMGLFTSERLNFLTKNPLTTPSLSSLNLNNVNKFDSKYFQVNLGKYDYSNNWATNIPKILNNSGVNLFKGVVDTFINAPLYTGQYIADNGIGETFNQIGRSFVDIGKSIKGFGEAYTNSWKDLFKNPLEHMQGEWDYFSNRFTKPETYEAITTAGIGLIAGKFGKSGIGDIYKAGNKVDDVAEINNISKIGKYDVGIYNEIKGVSGLDAHHVGQKSLMSRFISDYNPNSAPAILVPREGHTIRSLSRGIVSRSSEGITNVRQLIARDIMELRRVYPDIPNSQLIKLVNLNKDLYPIIRSK